MAIGYSRRVQARLATLGLALGLMALWAAPARSQPMYDAMQGPMRTVVRVAPDSGDELWSRVRGQTSDLDVVLTRADDAGEPALADQLQAASQLAAVHAARVVVWFRPMPQQRGVIVYVSEPGRDTVFVRRMPQREASATARSATAEAAALVVRSALRALAAGGRIGVATREIMAEPAPDSAAISWQLAVHWQAVADGASRAGHHGIQARVGARVRQWRVEAALATHPAMTLTDELTAIRVGRHSAALAISHSWQPGNELVVAAELGAGALAYTRSTVALSPEVLPRPSSRLVSLFASPGARVRVPLRGIAAGLSIELFVAADVLVRAPEFGYQTADRFVTRDRLHAVQPRAGLGLLLESR